MLLLVADFDFLGRRRGNGVGVKLPMSFKQEVHRRHAPAFLYKERKQCRQNNTEKYYRVNRILQYHAAGHARLHNQRRQNRRNQTFRHHYGSYRAVYAAYRFFKHVIYRRYSGHKYHKRKQKPAQYGIKAAQLHRNADIDEEESPEDKNDLAEKALFRIVESLAFYVHGKTLYKFKAVELPDSSYIAGHYAEYESPDGAVRTQSFAD